MTASTHLTKVFDEIQFDVSYVSGPSEVIYAFDYGDGAGRTSMNASNMLFKTYNVPGEYLVTAYGNEVGAEPDTVSIYLYFKCDGDNCPCLGKKNCFTHLRQLHAVSLFIGLEIGYGIANLFSFCYY